METKTITSKDVVFTIRPNGANLRGVKPEGYKSEPYNAIAALLKSQRVTNREISGGNSLSNKI